MKEQKLLDKLGEQLYNCAYDRDREDGTASPEAFADTAAEFLMDNAVEVVELFVCRYFHNEWQAYQLSRWVQTLPETAVPETIMKIAKSEVGL